MNRCIGKTAKGKECKREGKYLGLCGTHIKDYEYFKNRKNLVNLHLKGIEGCLDCKHDNRHHMIKNATIFAGSEESQFRYAEKTTGTEYQKIANYPLFVEVEKKEKVLVFHDPKAKVPIKEIPNEINYYEFVDSDGNKKRGIARKCIHRECVLKETKT